MTRLKQRVALVTGAGRGIGRAIAVAFAREGARVALAARSAGELEETRALIRQAGGEAVAFPADLAADGVPKRVVEQTAAALGPVEILVNNAGIGSSASPRPVADFDDAFWELSLRLNLTVPYLFSKAVLPAMLAKRWGRIIHVSSINGKVASFHGAAYAASKHGLLGLTRTTALEVAKDGVTVNALCPGPVRTAMNDKRVAYDAQRRGVSVEEMEKSMTPMGCRLEPEDVSPMAVYLAGDEAKMVTGQAMNVDGGLVMY